MKRESKMRYICKSCGYQFESKVLPKTCPYCNKGRVEEEKDAEELIEEVENLLD